MKVLSLAAVLLLLSGCTAVNTSSVGATSPMSATTPLNEEALRHLFLSGYNTYLEPVRSAEITISHPPGELFRPNGTYRRITGRTGLEGTYAIEGDRLCVTGDGIAKRCRSLIPQGGKTYLLVDAADGSRALMDLSQQR